MADQAVIMAVASYASTMAARADREAVRQARDDRDLVQIATAQLEKGTNGELMIDEHDTMPEDLPWSTALLGGPLAVIATPLGIQFLVSTMKSMNELRQTGAVAGRIWHEVPRDQLHKMSAVLDEAQAALVIVALEHDRELINALLPRARVKIVSECIWADFASGQAS